MNILSLPVALNHPESCPRNTLCDPSLENPDLQPMKVLPDPVILQHPEQSPAKKLLEPNVLQRPAQSPIKILLEPVVLDCPAQTPAKKFALVVL
jgi:hypothetical protein